MLLCISATFISQAQTPSLGKLISTKYETPDAVVARFNVLDYGADPTGTVDQTKLFQALLDSLGSKYQNRGAQNDGVLQGGDFPAGTPNGGVLFVPEGKYLFSSNNSRLTIPKGVTIRGDWKKPEKGKPIEGTIFMIKGWKRADSDADVYKDSEGRAFITLQPSAAVRDIAFWYPEQDPENITPYPPTILIGQNSYWGNDYCLVSNVTLVNSYDGVIFSRRNGGGAPNVYGIYGTPLKRGIEIDNIAEIGRVDNVDFSPEYWAGSGLEGSPTTDTFRKYIRANATALTAGRIDWSFFGNVKAEGYKTGYRLQPAFNDGGSPNGHFYHMEFTDCTYGVYAAATAGAGDMFYDYKFNNCDFGFYVSSSGGVLQIQKCEFDVKKAAIYAPLGSNTKMLLNQNTFNKGAIDIRQGTASIMANQFNDENEHIILGSKAVATITGNTFKDNDPHIKNLSTYKITIDHNPIAGLKEIPSFPYKNQYDFKQKPTGTAFSLATDHGVSTTNDDNSDALQVQLNAVKAAGGGIVFLPPGHYNFRKPITIPTGVELKGSVDTPSLPTGPGSTMEIYAGKGDENGTPFITMEEGSGIRGLVMNYPEQAVQLLTQPELNGSDVYHYPYCIRGNKDVYIVNIALRAVYHGVDLFTNKCDNHYIDYLAGHVFKTGIRVGGGSKDGHIYNAQFNQIAYGSGGETKFGRWPNSPDNNNPDHEVYVNEHDLAYAYCWNHLEFLVLEDCEDEILFNNFDFGSKRGFVMYSKNGKGPSGISLGQGIDQGMNAFYIDGVDQAKGFDLINSQIVTTAPGRAGDVNNELKANNRYIQVGPNLQGTVNFFAADFWGQPQNISNEILSGTIEMQAGNYDNSGQQNWASVAENAAFKQYGSNINSVRSLLTAGSPAQMYIQSSILNKGSIAEDSFGLWLNNIGFSGEAATEPGGFVDRTGWIATASVRNEDANLSLDDNTATRWSTMSENQKAGQWFKVDMLEEQTFTGINLDPGTASNTPAAIRILVSNDDIEYKVVATAQNATEVTFPGQKARYIKIEQTGSKSLSWRIAEFYITDLPDYTDYTGIGNLLSQKGDVNAYFNFDQLYLNGATGSSVVRIYSVAGQQVLPATRVANSISVNLPSGIYVAIIENNGNIYRQKLLKK